MNKKPSSGIILYGSSTGTTKILGQQLQHHLRTALVPCELHNIKDFPLTEILNFKWVLFGCPTWNKGEVQDDFLPFIDFYTSAHQKLNVYFAIFGPGDSSYQHFCKGVDILYKFIVDKNGTPLLNPLKIDLREGEGATQLFAWSKHLIDAIKSNFL